ncbi:MAG: magnesium transporter [Lentisphaerae bacterium]|nr:magnesium transporter [Lentisphaerota bacterium]
MIGNVLQVDLEEIIKAKNWTVLREVLAGLDPSDIAEVLIDLPPEDEGVIFRVLPRDRATTVFSYLPLDRQEELVQTLSNDTVHAILGGMMPDDRTRLLEELPADVTRRCLATLPPDELRKARLLLGYPEGTAGRYMTPDYCALPPDVTAREALDIVRQTGRGLETLAVLYVVGKDGKLIDDLRLGALVLADPETKVKDIDERPPVCIPATARGEDVVAAFDRYDRLALPVVDSAGNMLGIITADDVLEFAQQQATDEIHKLGGASALEKPYLDVGFWDMVRKRGGWLGVLFLGEMLTATAMGYFEGEIERAAVVALFIPLIISSGGNSGSQGTSLIIRSLALNELRLRDWWRVFGRELRTGLALGVLLGTVGFCRIGAWQALSHMPHFGHFFQTQASQDAARIPEGMKIIQADAQLSQRLDVPAFTLPAGAHVSRGMLLPQSSALPPDVESMAHGSHTASAYGPHWFLVGLTVFGALIGVVAWGSLCGSMLPFLLRRLGFDPATSSAPFVATLVDVTGLIIYFVVAKLMLTGTLL